jgi:hypothetical protein
MNNVSAQKISNDVKWVFESASLLDEGFCEVESFEIEIPSDDILEKICADYLTTNPIKSHQLSRLGLYFEYLFNLMIDKLSNHSVILFNYRLKDNHNLGEIDFITKDKNGKHYHWEIALKFYFQYGNGLELKNWMGPNAKDNFDKKWQKLIYKQVPFSQKPIVRQDLLAQNIEIEKALLFVKGMLFYHPRRSDGKFPDIVNPFHKKGWWIYAHEFSQYFSYQTKWVVLEKLNWIGTPQDLEIIDGRELHQIIGKGFKKAIMVGLLEDEINFSRGFIVPAKWPSENE